MLHHKTSPALFGRFSTVSFRDLYTLCGRLTPYHASVCCKKGNKCVIWEHRPFSLIPTYEVNQPESLAYIIPEVIRGRGIGVLGSQLLLIFLHLE